MKKILFLDIDGVLAGEEYLCTHRGCLIDPDCVKLINKLGEIGAEIVISSSWGYDEGKTEKSLKGCGLTVPIIGYTDHVSLHYKWLCRGNEIEKWLIDNFGGIATQHGKNFQNSNYRYVILDDDCDMLYGQKDNFIRISREDGLTEKDIETAYKILNGDD